jgi:site-specific recombinase XerD
VKYLNIVVLHDYILKHEKSGYDRATIDKKVAFLKTYTNFLYEFGEIDIDLLKKYYYKKGTKKKTTNYILDKEKDEICRFILESNSRTWKRDYAMITVLEELGIRRLELIDLSWENINFKDNKLYNSRVKGHNDDYLPMTDKMSDALQVHYANEKNPTGWVFKSMKGNKLSLAAYSVAIKKYIDMLELEKNRKASGHGYRHSTIFGMIEKGVSYEDIKRITGQRDINTIVGYSYCTLDMIKDALEKVENIKTPCKYKM